MANHRPLIVYALLLAGCATTTPTPLYDGLGDSGRVIRTLSAEAQPYFDQGLVLCWAFNHDAAVKSFRQAARLDPANPMPWWGIAYALGPNINNPAPEPNLRKAYRAIGKARARSASASPIERALIEAMGERYEYPPAEERQHLEDAFAAAMRTVFDRFPDDPDVGTILADALMNVSKEWRQWPVEGDRGPHTPEIVATLEHVLARHPDHPGANHFYVHAVEASARPERALQSSDRLRRLVPASGHLVHMPAHIYIRLGKYNDAIETNTEAVAADDAFFATAPDQGIYHYYRAHNHHFLIWAAMFQGDRQRALGAARDMVRKLPMKQLKKLPRSVEAFLFIPVHVQMRFGLWEEILAEPTPDPKFSIALALHHHARAVAYANTDRIGRALEEADAFERVAASVPPDKKVRKASVETILEIAREMMEGEILFKQGRHEEAFEALRKSIAAEDTLPYSEPPGWMQPVRHALGALLLEAGRVVEAEAVYREDLERHAENGWALHGLAECLRRTGRIEEAESVEERFAEAWAFADTEIHASCYCRRPDPPVGRPSARHSVPR